METRFIVAILFMLIANLGNPVTKKEYYFIAYEFKDLVSCLENKQFKTLKKLRYQPYEFKPETEIMVFKDAEAQAFLDVLKQLEPDDKGYF